MKNTTLSLITILISNFIMHSQCEPTNIINDPSFELDALALDMYGECASTSEYSCIWQRNDGGEITNLIAYDGNYSWVTYSGSAYQNSIELSPNTDYILSCWVNTTNTSEEYGITIGTFATGSWVGSTNGWEKISLPFTTAEDDLTSVMLQLACHGGQAYFDLFELCVSSALSVDEETLLSNITIYPNPNKGIVNINLNNLEQDKKVNIKVFNTIGQLIFHDKNIKQDNYQFHLNEAPGFYFIEINSNNKKQYFKLIKE